MRSSIRISHLFPHLSSPTANTKINLFPFLIFFSSVSKLIRVTDNLKYLVASLDPVDITRNTMFTNLVYFDQNLRIIPHRRNDALRRNNTSKKLDPTWQPLHHNFYVCHGGHDKHQIRQPLIPRKKLNRDT